MKRIRKVAQKRLRKFQKGILYQKSLENLETSFQGNQKGLIAL